MTTKRSKNGKSPPKAGAKARPGASQAKVAKAGKVNKAGNVRSAEPAARLIDQRIRELGGWRGETLGRMRALILEADPAVSEEWKWNNPVWSHGGIVCTGEAYTKVVKLTFARGAGVPDPSQLFNSSLAGNTRRAIDIHEGETVDARAFKALVKAAVARNGSTTQSQKSSAKVGSAVKSRSPAKSAAKVVLLSGGNPQIAKADGDAPVQAYIAAMPGWKSELGRRLDALVVRHVPEVRKAVRWNSPFYGIEGRGWFLSFHVFTRYVKLIFFRGASLRPVPPGAGKDKDARFLDIHEGDGLDETQLAAWVKQAAALPGWIP